MHSSCSIYKLILQGCLCYLVTDLFSTVAVLSWITVLLVSTITSTIFCWSRIAAVLTLWER